MKKIGLRIIILTTFCMAEAVAQSDSSRNKGYFPIFDNLQSDDDNGTANETNRNTDNTVADPHYQLGEDLRTLERYYNAGKYPDAINKSKQIKQQHRLNNEDNETYLRYTISSYKEMAYNREADSLMKIFTKKYPFYKLRNNDPVAFKDVFNCYYTRPQLSIWAKGGRSTTSVLIDTVYTIADTTQTEPSYSDVKAQTFEIGLQFYLTRRFSAAVSLNYWGSELSRVQSYGNSSTKFFYKESNDYISIPVFLIFNTSIEKINFINELMLGGSVDILFQSKYEAFSWFGDNSQYTITEREADLEDKTSVNYSLRIADRLNFNVKRFTFFVEPQLFLQMKPHNKSDRKYSNSDLVYNNLFVPDAIHLLTTQLNFGVKMHLFYKTIAKFGYGY